MKRNALELIKDAMKERDQIISVPQSLEKEMRKIKEDMHRDSKSPGLDIEEVEKESPLSAFFIKEEVVKELGSRFLDSEPNASALVIYPIKKFFAPWKGVKSSLQGKRTNLFFTSEKVGHVEAPIDDVAQDRVRECLECTINSKPMIINLDITYGIVLT